MKILICGQPARKERGLIKSFAKRAMEHLGLDKAELSVMLTDDAGIRELNSRYRGKDKPTDVLSFSMNDAVALGDIVISLPRAAAQAEEYGVTGPEELARLLVHGLLHLIGYEHVNGGRQARKMRLKEAEVMKVVLG